MSEKINLIKELYDLLDKYGDMEIQLMVAALISTGVFVAYKSETEKESVNKFLQVLLENSIKLHGVKGEV